MMYFGTRGHMRWVKTPSTGMDASRQGWNTSGTFLNGGGFVLDSQTKHKVYNMSWSFLRHNEVRDILDYADGLYGSGPIYFLDPMAQTTNVLPQYWAAPYLMRQNAPSLVVNQTPDTEVVTQTPAMLPGQNAVFTLSGSSQFRHVDIPVPEGYNLWVGGWGRKSGSAALACTSPGQTTFAVPLTDNNMVLDPFGPTGLPGGRFWRLTAQGTGELAVTGLMAQVLPVGTVPNVTRFLSGDGHSGCSFQGDPTVTAYSAPTALDYVSLAAVLVETEAWKW